MIVRARVENVRFEEFDIPEHLAEKFEEEIEMYVPQGKCVNYRTLAMWAKKKGIKLTPTY